VSVVRVRNASEAAMELIQREFPTYHPLVALARLAHDKRVVDDPKLEFEVHKAILPYVAPKLANIEVKQESSDRRTVVVSLFESRTLDDGRVVDVEVPMVTEAAELVPLD
jgi:hypothetical protein